jgi:hypothetical protein
VVGKPREVFGPFNNYSCRSHENLTENPSAVDLNLSPKK